ncbi:aKG-HExxH-type peptide beta-hydroxylase [Dietzia kunjamensis]|uniref:aKG-HExxH-type peptide beta-hydroxylase n=1 Tax=Dietzia kunjamensis TaxID=322509 RepID=UPI0039BC37A4
MRHELREIIPLDVDAETCHAVYERLRVATCESIAKVSRAVRSAGEVSAAESIEFVLATEPSAFRGAAGYRLLMGLVAAMENGDEPAFAEHCGHLGRFRAGALVASGGSGVVDVDIPACGILLPGTGLRVEPTVSGRIEIVDGEVASPFHRIPRVGGLSVSSHEPLLAHPRSRSQFALESPDPDADHRLATELERVRDRFGDVVPGFFDRYVGLVVPLVAVDGLHHAGTDYDGPFAVYLSGEREPGDLLAALAHEESHALVQSLEKLIPGVIPDSAATMPVPWKPGVTRTLAGVIHGVIAFSRAATVRNRIIEGGHGSPALVEARDREQGWVTGVVREVEDGALGPVSDTVLDWLVGLVEAVHAEAPASAAPVTATGVPADLREDASGKGWAVLHSAGFRACAARLHAHVEHMGWRRNGPPYDHQDLVRMPTQDFPELDGPIREWVASHYGEHVSLEAVKAHRLRAGDEIPEHDDSGSGPVFRLVIGACADEVGAVPLYLHDERGRRSIGWCPNWGSGLLFRTEGTRHSVPLVAGGYSRYTVVASYGR